MDFPRSFAQKSSVIDRLLHRIQLDLLYEYVHLAIPLGGLTGIVDFSKADIATVCREILDGLILFIPNSAYHTVQLTAAMSS